MVKKQPTRKAPAKTGRRTRKPTAETVQAPSFSDTELDKSQEAYRWPADVPLNYDNLKHAAQDFQVYLEGYNLPVEDEDDERDWQPRDPAFFACEPRERDKIRELVRTQPNMKRALKLYEIYVLGEFSARLMPKKPTQTAEEKEVIRLSELAAKEFLQTNWKHWSIPEWGRRTYRDGEAFTRLFGGEWPPQVRFIDPERIAGDGGNEQEGVVTAPGDVASVLGYRKWDPAESKVTETIPAEEIHHQKNDCDSTEKRGRSRFSDNVETAKMLRAMIRNEVNLRNAQSSIILVRKVAGGSGAVGRVTDNAKTSTTEYREGSINREKFRPGSIITTSKGVEIDFAQPDNNFSDAGPLVKVLIQQICAGTGWSYTMVSADSSDTNLAAGLVAESPVVQMVNNERYTLGQGLVDLFRWVFEQTVQYSDTLPELDIDTLWDEWSVDLRFADIVTREPLKDAQTVNLGVMNQTISRKEGSRRSGTDPDQMRAEIEEESKLDFYSAGFNGQNPDGDDKQASSKSNATKGSGTNQGGNA